MDLDLDLKEMQLRYNLYQKILNNKFDESDIYAFLILMRNEFEKDSWLFELSNLIAHRERDRGFVFNNLKSANESYFYLPLSEWDDHQRQSRKVLFDFQSINNEDFLKSFNKAIRKFDYSEISEHQIYDILLCIFSLMQFSKYESDYNYYGTLQIMITENEVSINTYLNEKSPMICMGLINNVYTKSNIEFIHVSDKPIEVLRDENDILYILYDNNRL